MNNSLRETLATSGQAFMRSSYNNGYDQGRKNLPYTGRTFIGYYGWLDGKQGVARRYV